MPGLMRGGFTDNEIAARFALPFSTIYGRITKLGLGHLRVRRLGGPRARQKVGAQKPLADTPKSSPSITVRVVSSGTTYAREGRMTLPPGWGGSFGHAR
ncbi:hypothetical protein [Gluconacetobacter sacchari]|uniref:Uncharacterized protein n=2 Tax=Gluconacetobacter sacchari TaxID=92759 RepID=A0A7W4IBB9_9PROT|nr:hypothetical protein [Gluconacetobacter sacchari]MBB2159708.1 hypothetical protein [Gluconacetobacter sacchari]